MRTSDRSDEGQAGIDRPGPRRDPVVDHEAVVLESGAVVIYHERNHHAWLQSDLVVDLDSFV